MREPKGVDRRRRAGRVRERDPDVYCGAERDGVRPGGVYGGPEEVLLQGRLAVLPALWGEAPEVRRAGGGRRGASGVLVGGLKHEQTSGADGFLQKYMQQRTLIQRAV